MLDAEHALVAVDAVLLLRDADDVEKDSIASALRVGGVGVLRHRTIIVIEARAASRVPARPDVPASTPSAIVAVPHLDKLAVAATAIEGPRPLLAWGDLRELGSVAVPRVLLNLKAVSYTHLTLPTILLV